jgi:hypothetical protein
MGQETPAVTPDILQDPDDDLKVEDPNRNVIDEANDDMENKNRKPQNENPDLSQL